VVRWHLLAAIGVVWGAWDAISGLPVALTAPEAIWEFSLSVWLLVRGFPPSPAAGSPGARRARSHDIWRQGISQLIAATVLKPPGAHAGFGDRLGGELS
jgi:hypothetical protein